VPETEAVDEVAHGPAEQECQAERDQWPHRGAMPPLVPTDRDDDEENETRRP
jgi:hypothetical protein